MADSQVEESQKGSKTSGVGEFLKSEAMSFLREPVGYSLTRFLQAIFIGFGITVLTAAVKIVVDAIAASIPL